MATGLTFPPDTRVKPYTGDAIDLPMPEMDELAQNVLAPETYIDTLARQNYELSLVANQPSRFILQGQGTLQAMQFALGKQYDPSHIFIQVKYGDELGIAVPLLAFFGEANQISYHRSTPIGLVDRGGSYLFYSNLPMPYQNGMELDLMTDSQTVIPIKAQIATSSDTTNTQLRVLFQPPAALNVYGPDFTVDIPGNGKMVGIVLVTKDQKYDLVPNVIDKKTGQPDAAKRKWPMGYLEGNLTLTDGEGNTRYYSGQEDWAEGGYYFNSGYTLPPGGSNRPFAGILKYKEGKDGYATLFRYFNDLSAFPFRGNLHLSFGHGTWNNNFPVTYGLTILYYHEVEATSGLSLPAINNQVVSQPQLSRQNP
jgi:hypothetical protein